MTGSVSFGASDAASFRALKKLGSPANPEPAGTEPLVVSVPGTAADPPPARPGEVITAPSPSDPKVDNALTKFRQDTYQNIPPHQVEAVVGDGAREAQNQGKLLLNNLDNSVVLPEENTTIRDLAQEYVNPPEGTNRREIKARLRQAMATIGVTDEDVQNTFLTALISQTIDPSDYQRFQILKTAHRNSNNGQAPHPGGRQAI